MGSGLDYKSITLKLNEKKLLAEYDLNKEKIFYKIKNKLNKGKYILSVEASDKTGNKSQASAVFYIE
jgi:hypothetical protein